ncbi:MAG: hypothetical protein K9N51_05470 [Candidatus Pacebacteria bacterium]|nr:hypothetical protein [Candidatus Paceibacterota bacterium]
MQQKFLAGLEDVSHGLPESERPVNRLMERSAEYLADSELLALIIGVRMSPEDALETSRHILSRAGGLHRTAAMSIRELMTVPKIGKATACALHSAFALASRRLTPAPEQRPRLESPGEVAAYVQGMFTDKQQEEFHALLVDTKNRLICDRKVTVGLLDRSQVHAREVFRHAIRDACSRIILTHNLCVAQHKLCYVRC